jgi:DNA-binding MarR family transcriptional regulator
MRPRSSAFSTIEKVYRLVKQIDEINLQGAEISMREAGLLEQIVRGAADIPSIAAHLGVSWASAKEILARMESRGFLRKIRVYGRREYTIEITVEGKKVLGSQQSLDRKTNEEIEKRLGKEALTLIAKMQKIFVAAAAASPGPATEEA